MHVSPLKTWGSQAFKSSQNRPISGGSHWAVDPESISSYHATWHGGSHGDTEHSHFHLQTVKKKQKKGWAVWARQNWASITSWGMSLILTALRGTPSSSTVLLCSSARAYIMTGKYCFGILCRVFFVDNSSWWGNVGLFTALEMRSHKPRKQYELAGWMKGLLSVIHHTPVKPPNVPI